MTEAEARAMLDEIRDPPRFIRGRYRYVVRRDGRVDVYRLSKSGKRSVFEYTAARDSYALHVDVRKALA